MPWKVMANHDGCDGFAVVKDTDGSTVACHKTKAEAEDHMKALYANVTKTEGSPEALIKSFPECKEALEKAMEMEYRTVSVYEFEDCFCIDLHGSMEAPKDDLSWIDKIRSYFAPQEDMTKSEEVKEDFIKSAEEDRYTLGPWYVPNHEDAHGEWTDEKELQKAAWDYVRKGNRDIYLQHNTAIKAGEWVEIMTLPEEFSTTKLYKSQEAITLPAGTVLMGVVWEDWAWEMVKSGKITGYSIGGFAFRSEQDLGE